MSFLGNLTDHSLESRSTSRPLRPACMSTCSLVKLSSPLYHDPVLRALHHGITLTQLLGVGGEFGSEPRITLLYPAVCQTLDCHAVPGFTSGLVSDMLASIWYAKKMGRRLIRSIRRSKRLQLQLLVGNKLVLYTWNRVVKCVSAERVCSRQNDFELCM